MAQSLDPDGNSSRQGNVMRLPLSDELALDRTVLANERTMLAYFRTMLALLAAGVSVLQFVDAWWAPFGGVALLAAAPLLLGYGVWRYRGGCRHIRELRRSYR